MTLEHAHERRGEDGAVVEFVYSGDGDLHRCRDWGVVERSMVSRRVDGRRDVLNAWVRLRVGWASRRE
jgi:hypothetical protein